MDIYEMHKTESKKETIFYENKLEEEMDTKFY